VAYARNGLKIPYRLGKTIKRKNGEN